MPYIPYIHTYIYIHIYTIVYTIYMAIYIYIYFSFTDLLGNLGAPPAWPVVQVRCLLKHVKVAIRWLGAQRSGGDFSWRNRARNWGEDASDILW